MEKQRNIHLAILIGFAIMLGIIFLMRGDNQTPDSLEVVSGVTEDTPTDDKAVVKEDVIAQTLSDNPDKQDLTELQDALGSEIVMEVDCELFNDEESRQYCNTQQQLYTEFFNEVTWASVTSHGHEYTLEFDCSQIVAIPGQEECSAFQAALKPE